MVVKLGWGHCIRCLCHRGDSHNPCSTVSLLEGESVFPILQCTGFQRFLRDDHHLCIGLVAFQGLVHRTHRDYPADRYTRLDSNPGNSGLGDRGFRNDLHQRILLHELMVCRDLFILHRQRELHIRSLFVHHAGTTEFISEWNGDRGICGSRGPRWIIDTQRIWWPQVGRPRDPHSQMVDDPSPPVHRHQDRIQTPARDRKKKGWRVVQWKSISVQRVA